MTNSTLTTGGGVALNNRTTYWVNSIDLGDTGRSEFWLKPAVLGAVPILGGYVDDVGIVTIHLRILGSSLANLQTLMEAVRNEFLTAAVNTTKGGDNFITWTPAGSGSGTTKTIVTYATKIPAFNLAQEQSGAKALRTAAREWQVLDWPIAVTRQPYFYEDTAGFKTPVM